MNTKTKYKIYATETCPFCSMAKNMLERKGYKYEYITLSLGSELITELQEMTRHHTVPLIFEVDEETSFERFIGGFDDLQKKICKI